MTPALGAMAAWCAGIALGTAGLSGRPSLGAAALLAAALAALAAALLRPALAGLVLAAALLGIARAELPATDPGTAARAAGLAGARVTLAGTVADDPRPTADGYEVLVAPESLATAAGHRSPAGNVLVLVRGFTEPAPGDHVRVAGRLDRPRDEPGFDRRAYLAQRGAFLEIRSGQLTVDRAAGGARGLPLQIRERYRRAIAELLPSPHAQVLVGVVLGVRSGIPPELQRDLVATGLVHLLVLSGLKVAVFTRLVLGPLGLVLGRAAAVPALCLIVLYALAGGATPAAVRAAAMGGLVLVAARLGRPTHVWTALAATAAAMLGWRPDLVWDVGFQLSFVGTAALIVLSPGIERRLGWLPGPLREPFAVTCAAQVGAAPLMATDFHLLPVVSPIANAAVLPLLPFMVAGGFVLAPLALLPGLGRLLALPMVGLLTYLEQVAALLAHLPAASIGTPAPPVALGAAYYLAVGAALVAGRTEGRRRLLAIGVGLCAPALIGGAELVAWDRAPAAVTVLAVGDGQAVLLHGPGGYALIDGGPSPSRLGSGLGTHLPPWRRELEGLFLTGPGQGHIGGLAGFDRSVAVVVVPGGGLGGTAMRNAALEQLARGARLVAARAGQRLVVAGLEVEVLSPEPGSPDPGQLALRVWGPNGHPFCDLADLDPEAQLAAAARLAGGCEALLLPVAGRSAPDPELLRAARARRLIVSDAGTGRLSRDLPATVMRTSQEGDITLPL